MESKQILQKAIEKALDNGMHYKDGWDEVELMFENAIEFIFSHDFAKAFWGEDSYSYWADGEYMDNECSKEDYEKAMEEDNFWEKWLPNWQYHLQQMVLEEEPLKYLEKFL